MLRAPRPVRILGNRDRLQQVLFNLVDNSIKFSDDGGTITIGLEQDGELVRVRVSDEGIGISKADLPRVFDLAYRSPIAWSYRHKGSGLGLAIAKRIVEEHHGQIHIESWPGEGTIVTVELPAAALEDKQPADGERPLPSGG